jgi:two-component system cell cycle response regulator
MGHPVYERLKNERLLPSPKGVAMEVLRLVDREMTTIEEIAAVIETDPSLAARLLRLVNSPLTRTSRPIVSLATAAAMLGLRSIKHLALCFSLVSENKTGPCSQFDYAMFWSSSLARAVGGGRLSRIVGGFAPDEVFSCALLSKIGRLALASAFPESYGGTIAIARQEGGEGSLRKLERDFYEIDHNDLAAEMLADWGLPPLFVQAVRAQDTPDELEGGDSRTLQLSRILYVAGVMAELLVRDPERQDVLGVLVRESGRMKIAPEDLEDLFKSVGISWRDMGHVYSIETRSVLTLSELYGLAAQQRWKMELRDHPRGGDARS